MASKKKFEVGFKLSAALAPAFSGTIKRPYDAQYHHRGVLHTRRLKKACKTALRLPMSNGNLAWKGIGQTRGAWLMNK